MIRRPLVVPAAWLLLAVVAMVLSDKYLPIARIPLPGAHLAAQALLIISLSVFALSVWQFHRSRTTVDPRAEATNLITTGVFRYSRNPVYLAMVLLLSAIAVRLGSASAWLFVVVFVWIIQSRQIAWEEQQLAAKFSDAYAAYCQRVRRWI